MVEGQEVDSSDSKFGNFLDSIDRFSKRIESSINGTNNAPKTNNAPMDVVEKSDSGTVRIDGC
jgi:hypothetical protein